jgi:hypothetical protein
MSKPAIAPIAPEDLVAVHGGVLSSDDQLKNAITKIQTDLKDAVSAQRNQPNPLQQMMPVLVAAKLSGRI